MTAPRHLLVPLFIAGRRCADPGCADGMHTNGRWCLYPPPLADEHDEHDELATVDLDEDDA